MADTESLQALQADVKRLDLRPGDVLAVVIKDSAAQNADALATVRLQLEVILASIGKQDVKAIVFAGDIDLSIIRSEP